MKSIFITGASGAIGSACCKAFLEKGCNVAAIYNNNESGARKNEQYATTSTYLALKADVTDSKSVKEAFARAVSEFGSIDTVVNCAGISLNALVQDTTDDMLSAIVDTNIKGTFYVCREAVEHMVSNHTGSIVNISSMWGEVGASCESCYSMSKAAVIGLTKALAKEVGPSNVRVNCITPGLIDTPMNDCYSSDDLQLIADETPLMRIGKGEDVANAVLFLSGDDSLFVTGQIIGVNGGYVI